MQRALIFQAKQSKTSLLCCFVDLKPVFEAIALDRMWQVLAGFGFMGPMTIIYKICLQSM